MAQICLTLSCAMVCNMSLPYTPHLHHHTSVLQYIPVLLSVLAFG